MTEAFIEKKFAHSSLAIIKQANAIIADYAAQGFRLTLRQLYYQFVARDLIANTQRSYKRLGNIISEARLAGLVDWDAIEDRTRNLETNPHWRDPARLPRLRLAVRAVGRRQALRRLPRTRAGRGDAAPGRP